ncbi:hypothetical protein K438DRAFT_753846 [Mycena galopus ATCC 62051]|nr:hypothetical protein K438DRAFT_753846 [Mycena galopus ATCC 62051]
MKKTPKSSAAVLDARSRTSSLSWRGSLGGIRSLAARTAVLRTGLSFGRGTSGKTRPGSRWFRRTGLWSNLSGALPRRGSTSTIRTRVLCWGSEGRRGGESGWGGGRLSGVCIQK